MNVGREEKEAGWETENDMTKFMCHGLQFSGTASPRRASQSLFVADEEMKVVIRNARRRSTKKIKAVFLL